MHPGYTTAVVRAAAGTEAPPAERVLIVRLTALGDVILVTHLARALRRSRPGIALDLLTDARIVPLLETLGAFDRVIGWDRRGADAGLGGVLRVKRRLLADGARYHAVLDLQNKLRTWALGLVLWAPRRAVLRKRGIGGVLRALIGRDRTLDDRHVLEMYLEAARKLALGGPLALPPRGESTLVRAPGGEGGEDGERVPGSTVEGGEGRQAGDASPPALVEAARRADATLRGVPSPSSRTGAAPPADANVNIAALPSSRTAAGPPTPTFAAPPAIPTLAGPPATPTLAGPPATLTGAAPAPPRPVRLIGLGAGTTHAPKRWPHFAGLAAQLAQTHPEARFLVIGGPGDRPELDAIRALVDPARLDPRDTAALDPVALLDVIRELDLLVSVDSGAAHLAQVSGVPTLVLFGPTSPTRWGPHDAPHRALSLGLVCAPCSNVGSAACTRTDRPYACLRELTPAAVADAARALLAAVAAQPPLAAPEPP